MALIRESLLQDDTDNEAMIKMLREHWFNLEGESGERCMDFEGFLHWFRAHSFEQALLLPGKHRQLRKLARDVDADVSFVESAHRAFRVHADPDAKLCYSSFRTLVLDLLGASEDQISEGQLRQFWRDARPREDETLDF